MKTMKLATLFIAASLMAMLNACASTETPPPPAEAAPKLEAKAPPPSSERVAKLKQLVEASKTRTLTIEEWKEIGDLSGWNELSDSADKALQEKKTPPKNTDLIAGLIREKEREMQMQNSLDAANGELKAKAAEMETLIRKVDELSKGQAKAVDLEDLSKSKEENRNLQRENASLKERVKALSEVAESGSNAQSLKGQVGELKARIERLKVEYVAPERHQAAVDDAQRLRADNSVLQAENAGLKQALAEAKARGDEACKFTEQLTARFDALSRKYEQLNEYLRKQK